MQILVSKLVSGAIVANLGRELEGPWFKSPLDQVWALPMFLWARHRIPPNVCTACKYSVKNLNFPQGINKVSRCLLLNGSCTVRGTVTSTNAKMPCKEIKSGSVVIINIIYRSLFRSWIICLIYYLNNLYIWL